MPLPPSDENGENKTPDEGPQLHFSYVECLMFAFHKIGHRCPDFLAGDDNTERLKDFRSRSVARTKFAVNSFFYP